MCIIKFLQFPIQLAVGTNSHVLLTVSNEYPALHSVQTEPVTVLQLANPQLAPEPVLQLVQLPLLSYAVQVIIGE